MALRHCTCLEANIVPMTNHSKAKCTIEARDDAVAVFRRGKQELRYASNDDEADMARIHSRTTNVRAHDDIDMDAQDLDIVRLDAVSLAPVVVDKPKISPSENDLNNLSAQASNEASRNAAEEGNIELINLEGASRAVIDSPRIEGEVERTYDSVKLIPDTHGCVDAENRSYPQLSLTLVLVERLRTLYN